MLLWICVENVRCGRISERFNVYSGKSYPEEFGAKVFKIARDEQGNRLTYMKLTGGSLKVKELLTNCPRKVRWKMKHGKKKPIRFAFILE